MHLTKEVLVLTFTLTGVNLKLADFYGERDSGYLSYIFAAISALCMGLLISDNSSSSSIMFGIIIGVILAGKLDQPNMITGLGIILLIVTILGLSIPNLPLLSVIALASLIDEVFHNKITSNGHFNMLFRFRMILKIVMILLTVLMLVEIVYVLGFFCFDLSYDFLSIIFEKRHK